MTDRWEYHILFGPAADKKGVMLRDLNGMGAQGWEAVSMTRGGLVDSVLLKRRMHDE